MYTGLSHLHSTLRYIVVLLLILSIIVSISGFSGNKSFTKGHRKLALFTLISLHLQLVIGLVLYFGFSPLVNLGDMATAMSNPVQRFFTIEHLSGMLLGILIITIGNSKLKKAKTDKAKFRKWFWYFTIGFVIIFFSIPWPFLKDFGTWI